MTELYVGNLNLTQYIQQQTDVIEQVRKVYGNNGGMSISGEEFEDLITVKIDPSFRLKPLPRDAYNQVMAVMKQSTVTVRYTSVISSALRSIQAAPLEMTAHYVMDSYSGARIYDGEIISFRQVSATW